jgi:hypothetical protein
MGDAFLKMRCKACFVCFVLCVLWREARKILTIRRDNSGSGLSGV